MPLIAIVLIITVLATTLHAQTAPSQSEIATYEGLHLAAHTDDVARITHLAAQGADLNARDRDDRTPAHVAAFASNDAALQALATAGADMNALDDEVYDVLTIAAVANDPDMVSLALTLGNRPD